MLSLDEIIGQKQKMYDIASHYHVTNLRVFGFVARGESNESILF